MTYSSHPEPIDKSYPCKLVTQPCQADLRYHMLGPIDDGCPCKLHARLILHILFTASIDGGWPSVQWSICSLLFLHWLLFISPSFIPPIDCIQLLIRAHPPKQHISYICQHSGIFVKTRECWRIFMSEKWAKINYGPVRSPIAFWPPPTHPSIRIPADTSAKSPVFVK